MNTVNPILILGGKGKTGGRLAEKLAQQGVPVRLASRSTSPSFDWNEPAGWSAALQGVGAVYVSYQPDLAVPGAKEAVGALTALAIGMGVKRIVLLSGRGEEEAQAAERMLQASGADWTIVRASWFNQNFSEGAFVENILAGELALPAGAVREPFVDADDIAEIAAAAFLDERHIGQIYEVTGPELLTFGQAVEIIARASGRDVQYVQLPHEVFKQSVAQSGLPDDLIWLLDELFTRVLDGRNEYLADGVQRALGRPPRSFADFAARVARQGAWSATATAA